MLFIRSETGAEENSQVQANASYPGDTCCRLYAGQDFKNKNSNFCLADDEDEHQWNLKDYGFNNLMSSWSCGKNVSYDFCNTTDWYCSSNTDSNSGAGNIASGLVGNNNFASSLKLARYDP